MIVEFILAAVVGFVIAMLINKWRSKKRKEEINKAPENIREKIMKQKNKIFILQGKRYDLLKAIDDENYKPEIIKQTISKTSKTKKSKKEKVSVADLVGAQK